VRQVTYIIMLSKTANRIPSSAIAAEVTTRAERERERESIQIIPI